MLGALLICAVSLPLLSSCTLFNRVFHRGKTSAACHEHPFAGNTDSRPQLKVPEGLSAPDTRNAVKIPELAAPERQRAKSEPCLAMPPNFFAQPLPVQPPASKRSKKNAPQTATPATAAPAPMTPAPATPAAPTAAPATPAPAAPAPATPESSTPAPAPTSPPVSPPAAPAADTPPPG
jgi:hypothetical protein